MWERGAGREKELRRRGDPVPSKSKPIPFHLCVPSIPTRSHQSLALQLPPVFHPASVTLLPRDVSLLGPSWTVPKPVDLSHPCLHPGACISPHRDLPAGNFLLCCKDLLQMLMLSFRWRALRLICQNTFHTLLLKLCPLLFSAFKLKRSPACRRHARRELTGYARLRGRWSNGLSVAQMSIRWLVAPRAEDRRGGRAG